MSDFLRGDVCVLTKADYPFLETDKVKITGDYGHIGHKRLYGVTQIFGSRGGFVWEDRLAPLDQAIAESRTEKTITQKIREYNKHTMKGKVMSVVDKLKNLNLDGDERLLRKYGILDETGALTNEGTQTTRDYAFKLVREDILADLKKLEAAEKAK